MKAIILAVLVMFSLNGVVQAKSNDVQTANPAASSNAQTQGNDAPVKKSKTGICHAPGTTYYARTQNFTPFKNLDECLKSGGRMPKR